MTSQKSLEVGYETIMKGNVIICGAPRAGSTALYRYLSAHPEVSWAKVKELNYFIGNGTAYQDLWKDKDFADLDTYANKFEDKGCQWLIEASPAYMHPSYALKVASRIQKMVPEAHLIFILRNPVDRLYSHFDGLKKRTNLLSEDFTFANFVSSLTNGDNLVHFGIKAQNVQLESEGVLIGGYAHTIKTYLDFFPSENIKIVFTENMAKAPRETISEVCGWLSLSSKMYDDFKFNIENKMISANNKQLYMLALHVNRLLEPLLNRFPNVRHVLRGLHHSINAKPNVRSLDEATEQMLHEYYAPHNEELSALLDCYWPTTPHPIWLKKK